MTANGIGVLSFNRPEKRNALLPSMLEELVACAQTSEAQALVVAGHGRTFCAGFDLDACDEDAAELDALLVGLARAVEVLRGLAVPVVMAVQGAAVAGGCALLAGADYVVSHPTAKLGYPVLRIGVSPAVSAPTLAAKIGTARARELMLRPDLIDGVRAREIGLVDRLVDEPDDVLEAAIEVAGQYTTPSPKAQRQTADWVDQLDALALHGRAALETSRSLVGTEEQLTLLKRAVNARKDR